MSVFICGNNKASELGQGPGFTDDSSTTPLIVDGLRGRTIASIKAGEQFTIALTSNGDVYTWGRGREGQLGLGGRENVSVPTRVDALAHEVVTQIGAGWQHALCLAASGRLYTFGSLHELKDKSPTGNDEVPVFGTSISLPGFETRRIVEQSSLAYFSGGNDEQEAAVRELNFGAFRPKLELLPVAVPFFDDKVVTCVAGGYSFSVVVTDDGACWTFGVNEVGQLGHGHKFNSHLPVRVAGVAHEHIVGVACGQQHVLALTRNGTVYSWGLGVFGQLGTGTLHNSTRPKLIAGISGATGVQCGAHFSVVLRADDAPFVFGHAEWGQHSGTKNYADWDAGDNEAAGRGAERAPHARPRVPEALQNLKVDAIACGSLHSIAVVRHSAEGAPSLLTWGWGSSGCLGHGDRRFQLVPKEVFALAGTQFSHVAAGSKHTIAVASTTSFALDFVGALADSLTADVVFVVGAKRRLYAHASLLRARLPGLERLLLFQQRFTREHGAPLERADADAAKRCVRLGAVQFQVLRALLIYAYTDQLQCPPHLFLPLARLAFQCGAARLAALAWRRAELAGHAGKRFPALADQTASGAAQRDALANERRNALAASTLVHDLGSLVAADAADEADAASAARRAADVTLRVADTDVRAHRWVLTARSAYFKQLFEGGFSESRSLADEIPLDGISAASLRIVLLHLYTGETDSLLSPDNVVDVLAAADMLLLDPLKQRCESLLMDALDPDDAPWMFGVSELFGVPKLRHSCKKLLLEQGRAAIDALASELSPTLLAELRASLEPSGTACF